MRVIAGAAKGTRLRSPTTGTRPMMDRMKESVFSALGSFDDSLVLDLYAGSGSLGIEALSRGAKKGVFVESAREAIVKLEQNLEATGLSAQADVIWADVRSRLAGNPEERFHLVFLDPPYNAAAGAVTADLENLVTGGFLADDGRIVVHRPSKESLLQPLGLQLVWERDFGQSRVMVFAHEDEEEDR